ncbi:MAG: S1 RNA-binding domain-containing protein, partial [Deltaproteobacteria bacterium]|nr:S1 RNA-binding domain-containing protein [Deltaproteobacteria bacterium]
GAVLTGRVTRMVQFGAFVELEPGVEGLIHISNFGTGRRINHPKEVVSEGEKLEVRVLSVDNQARRIGLELVFSGPAGVASPVPEIREGDVLVGTVDAVKDYGVFVGLPGGKSGLLHVSEMGDARKGDLRNRFPLGSSVQVEVLAIDPETKKVALSTKSLSTRMEESHFKEFATTQRGAGSLWTLGDLLKDKLKQ